MVHNNKLFSRLQYKVFVIGLFVTLLFALNLFESLNINIINEEFFFNYPPSPKITFSDHPKTTSLFKIVSKDISNETTLIDSALSRVRTAIHDNNSNTTVSIKKHLTTSTTATKSSISTIVSTNGTRSNNPFEQVDLFKLKKILSTNTSHLPSISKINGQVNNNNNNQTTTTTTTITNRKKLSTPIFIVSLPKSATSSMSVYFMCGGYNTADQRINETVSIGQCYNKNVQNGYPPFQGCGNYDVWSDVGHLNEKDGTQCYFPNINGLNEFYKYYPNGTIILMTRSTNLWYSSIQRYIGGKIKLKMILCNSSSTKTTTTTTTNFPNLYATHNDWKNMYEWHQQYIRTFIKLHPSITYLEFSVDDPYVSQKLEQSTGIQSKCWKKVNTNNNNIDFKRAAYLINNQKPGTTLPKDIRNLKPILSPNLKQLRNLDQVTTTDSISTLTKKKLPTPILVAGLPDKSTSIRIHNYFTCGGYKSVHVWTQPTRINNNTNNKQIRIGKCYKNNVNHGRPPLKGCGDNVDVWTETGYVTSSTNSSQPNNNIECYHPTIDGLNEFKEAYPNGTIILFSRRSKSWLKHLYEVNNSNLRIQLEQCNTTGTFLPGGNKNTSREEWGRIHATYESYIRFNGYQYLSLTYLEFSIHDPQLSNHLEEVIGIKGSCWK